MQSEKEKESEQGNIGRKEGKDMERQQEKGTETNAREDKYPRKETSMLSEHERRIFC
jgi:hypothetical protein